MSVGEYFFFYVIHQNEQSSSCFINFKSHNEKNQHIEYYWAENYINIHIIHQSRCIQSFINNLLNLDKPNFYLFYLQTYNPKSKIIISVRIKQVISCQKLIFFFVNINKIIFVILVDADKLAIFHFLSMLCQSW